VLTIVAANRLERTQVRQQIDARLMPAGSRTTDPFHEKIVGVQSSWFWGSEEGGERAAGLVGGVKGGEVGE
jgi:hypothetical protein